MEYGKKLKISEIISLDKNVWEQWGNELGDYVNKILTRDNVSHDKDAVGSSQQQSWLDCFSFIKRTLSGIASEYKDYELIFEYSLPGTAHQRPDIILLTDKKVIFFEFKRKVSPQISDDRDDIKQVIRYKEWIENHHKITRDRSMEVKSYIVCTAPEAVSGVTFGINVLAEDNFASSFCQELSGERNCSFAEDWLKSTKTEMPDMLQAIEIMYRDKKIPYISDVNIKCLRKVLGYIQYAKNTHSKVLILVSGVPGAGKTAVGQSVVFEENRNGEANALYLSGNGPLVEVLQYEINEVCLNEHAGENAIQGMKGFKEDHFYNNTSVPQQSILVFDESQRAWDEKKMKQNFSEPEGLLRVADRIYKERGYAVVIGLYGEGQAIYKGEETGLPLWEDALITHSDWGVAISDKLPMQAPAIANRKTVDPDLFLSASLRADFIDCSKWVEKTISRSKGDFIGAKAELSALNMTSFEIYVTRDFSKIREHCKRISEKHKKWKYGLLISNFAEATVLTDEVGWKLGFKKSEKNLVQDGCYGPWFTKNCKRLQKACSIYGAQGLELDYPIAIFGGDYIREGSSWVARGWRYDLDVREGNYKDTAAIVENNYRVLLTRARKGMVLFIPNDVILDETYQYFLNMGMSVL